MENQTITDPTSLEGKKEINPVLIGLLVTLLMVMAAGGFFGWRAVETERDNTALTQTVEQLMAELDEVRNQASRDKTNLMTVHQAEVDRLEREMAQLNEAWNEQREEWRQQMVKRESDYQDRLEKSFETMATVVEDSGSTLQYLEEMEAKVKEGKTLRQAELDQLKVVARGLSYLQAQYEKPLAEFRELENSIQRKIDETEPGTDPASEDVKFLRKIFSRDYREQVEAQRVAFLKDQGKREALVGTQQEVAARYASAQREMEAIRNRFGTEIGNLDQLIAVHDQNSVEMASFFEVSSEMLKVHRKVLDLEFEPLPEPAAPIDLADPPTATLQP